MRKNIDTIWSIKNVDGGLVNNFMDIVEVSTNNLK